MHIPSQPLLLQGIVSTEFPMVACCWVQVRPPFNGRGFVHVLVLVVLPPPQVRVHVDH